MGKQNDVPIPRANKPKRNTRGPRDTRLSFRPEPSRIDSVLDVYAELYADEPPHDESLYRPLPSPSRAVPLESIQQPVEPWDERGKTGLYGGGGRGADDRETGWVRGYSIGSSVPSVGFEEDLRFDDQDEHDTPRSSSETAQSGSYPVTPTSSHFPPQAPTANRPASTKLSESPRSFASPARSTHGVSGGTPSVASSSHSRTPSASQTGFRTPERPRRADLPVRDAPLSPADLSALRRKAPQPTRFPAVEPVEARAQPLEQEKQQQLSKPQSPAPTPKRSNSIFKKYGRSKKAPPISNPILPDGFVESLGMKTFTLTPGCKAPVFGGDEHSILATPRTPDQPSLPLNQPPRPRDVAPTARPTPPRPSPGSQRSIHRTQSSNEAPPSRPPPAHSFDPTVHRQSDVYPQDALARLSLASDASTRSVPAATVASAVNPTNHRQFFDQLRREEREDANAAEVLAPTNRAVAETTIPSYPLREHAWGTAALVSREDERGHSIHYDSRGNEVVADDTDLDSATSSYSEHSDFGAPTPASGRQSVAAARGHGLGGGPHRDVHSYYYHDSQPTSRDTRYDLAPAHDARDRQGYDRWSSNVVEEVASVTDERRHDDEEDYSRFGAGPIQPLNVKRTPPMPSHSNPPVVDRGLARFNRGGGRGGGGPGGVRGSTIDPLSSFAGVKKTQVRAGPAIGATGFRNPFG